MNRKKRYIPTTPKADAVYIRMIISGADRLGCVSVCPVLDRCKHHGMTETAARHARCKLALAEYCNMQKIHMI